MASTFIERGVVLSERLHLERGERRLQFVNCGEVLGALLPSCSERQMARPVPLVQQYATGVQCRGHPGKEPATAIPIGELQLVAGKMPTGP